MTISRRGFLAACAATASGAAFGQSPAFTRPVRLIVPFPAGTTPDILGRVVAPALSASIGQPVVVDNRAGAGGRLGTEQIAHATDGHTFGLSYNGAIATAPALFPKLAYDPKRDLAAIALIARTPQVLVIGAQVPATDMASFLAYARANPGKLSYGSIGNGSAGHLSMEELKLETGIDVVHVPYRGFPQATLELIAGQIQAMFTPVAGALPHIKEGKIRALAVAEDARLRQLPDVPTMTEAGVANAVSFGWNGLFAPASTPAAVIAQLAGATRAALEDPATRTRLDDAGFAVSFLDPAAFAAFIDAETRRWGGLITRLDIKGED
jgi:tripartite-type tricarboxylate transporter receptor subunit TctC